LIDESGSDGEVFGELEAGDFFGDFVDDGGGDFFAGFGFDEVDGGLGADEEIDLAGFFSLGGILKKGAVVEGVLGNAEEGKEFVTAVINEVFELEADDGVPSFEGFEWAESVDSFGDLVSVRLDVFEVEADVVIAEAIAEGTSERLSGGGADGVVGSDESCSGKIIECLT